MQIQYCLLLFHVGIMLLFGRYSSKPHIFIIIALHGIFGILFAWVCACTYVKLKLQVCMGWGKVGKPMQEGDGANGSGTLM